VRTTARIQQGAWCSQGMSRRILGTTFLCSRYGLLSPAITPALLYYCTSSYISRDTNTSCMSSLSPLHGRRYLGFVRKREACPWDTKMIAMEGGNVKNAGAFFDPDRTSCTPCASPRLCVLHSWHKAVHGQKKASCLKEAQKLLTIKILKDYLSSIDRLSMFASTIDGPIPLTSASSSIDLNEPFCSR